MDIHGTLGITTTPVDQSIHAKPVLTSHTCIFRLYSTRHLLPRPCHKMLAPPTFTRSIKSEEAQRKSQRSETWTVSVSEAARRESENQPKYFCWALFSAVAMIIVYFTSPSPRICPNIEMAMVLALEWNGFSPSIGMAMVLRLECL